VDAANEPLRNLALQTIYDPVARTVSIRGPDGAGPWLTPGAFYRLVLLAAATGSPSDVGGFRAIDRAPLGAAREYLFRAEAPAGLTYEPPVDFCQDVLPIFVRKCGRSCHDPDPQAFASLVLTTPEGLRTTARGRVAQGSNTGGFAGSPAEQGPVFGINMPIIKPGDPGSSWLMYKIELAPHPVVDAGQPSTVACNPPLARRAPPELSPLAPYRPAASDEEHAILSDYILGREMPYPSFAVAADTQPLTFQERERIRIWIAKGASDSACRCEARPAY
jgi:hypothetical protein